VWLSDLFGFDGGQWYSFWSGAGADLGELAIIGAVVGMYRRHNCHMKGCWRIGKQPVDGTSWTVCHHHHPAGAATPDKLAAAHERHVAKLAAEDVRNAQTIIADSERGDGTSPVSSSER